MSKAWSDVAGSSAFRALSLEQQEEARTQYFDSVVAPRVPTEDLEVARSQFLSSTKLPEAAPAPVEKPAEKGIIQRIKDAVIPEYKSVLETQAPTPQQEQANVNQRLSLGAGPISKETAAKADLLRSGMLKEPATLPVQKAAAGLAEQNVPTFAELAVNKEREAEDAARLGRQQFAEANPLLGSVASGAASMLAGNINIPTVAADVFNKTVIDPVLKVAGFEPMKRVGNMFGTEYLDKSASDFMPAIGKKSMTGAWNREEFSPWLMSKLAANSPQVAQQLIGAFSPALRGGMLLSMSGTAAGQSFAQGDDSRVAMMKGAIEYATEKLPLGVFDKVGEIFKGMPVPKQNAILAIAGQRILQAGAQVTANTLTNAIEETAAQYGGNVLDKYLQGKDIDINKDVAESALVGGLTGTMMSTPQVAATLGGANERPFEQPAPEVSTAEQMAKERGFLVPERKPTQLTNFTPADSPTKAAGLVDVVVPVPMAAPSITPVNPLAEVQINPQTEQQFGLDKLRLGTTNVGVPSTTGTTNVTGGAVGGTELGGGVGAAGPSVSRAAGAVAPATAATQLGGGQVAAAGAATGEQPTALKQEWYGRRGDGYVTKPDAEQALPGRQRMFPDLQWQVDELPNGKYRLAGYETKPEAAQAVVGEKINKDWTAFSPESGSLGIPRADMPQVKSEHRGAMVNFLNARGITSEQESVDPSTLKPTQAEFSPAKVEMAKENRGTDRAILVSSDNRVIDGHHQWMAKLESGEPVNVIKLNAPASELIDAIKEFPSSTTATGANLGTQTTEAIQAAQEGQQAPAFGPATTAATTAANVPSVELAGLKLAPQASMRVISSVRKELIKDNVEIAPVPQVEMNDSQKAASAVANLLGKTLTVVRYESGNKASMPNGMIDKLGGKNIFVDNEAEDSPLFVVMHEAHHGLPQESRVKLNTALNSLFKEDMRAEFSREFNYTEDQLDEEIPAFMVQAISKRADFWEQLRAKMGNKDFAEVAKHILSKLNEIVAGARKQYGEDFVSKYIKDVEKARDLLTTAYAEAINNKSITESAKHVVPLSGPVAKTEAIVDGVMYSARSRDLVKLPTVQFKDLLGKRVFGIKADLTDAGVSYTGIDGSQLEFPIEMMGGPNFVALPANVRSNVIWAVRGGATLTKIMKVVGDSDYIIVHAMNNNSHLTNATISQAYIQTVEAYLKDKRISVKNLRALDKIVRSPANKNSLPDFVGFESPNIIEYIDGLSFDQRGALAKILEKKEAQIHGLPNLDRFRRETIDPEYAGYRQGDAMLVIEVDKKNPTVKLGEEGTKMHPSYPLGLRGKVVGKLAKGINYELIYRDYFENKVPTLANKEAGAWYTFDRVMPVQEITPEIAASVSEGGYKAIKSARQAEASLALANNNWLVSGKTKAEGGVSVQEFVDALAANEGAAALTMYTPEQVKAGIKDKSFSVYQLGKQGGDKGLQVFFGLKRGAPWYKGMIDGVSDNEVEVVSVTNNETGAQGVGIPAIITKAIQEGATILDAFAVKSKRFPDGFLPEMYSQFGFETIGSIPFDSSFYDANQMADLKKFWADGGWKESDGYPDVVVMKWKGNDDERATAIERYARSGATGVSGRGVEDVRAAAAESRKQRNGSRAEKGRAKGANAGQVGGDQGVGNAAPVVRRAYDSIQELASLSAGDIRNLGLDPAEVAKLKQSLGGIQLSKRAGSPEPIGRSSIGRDKGDSAKVEGAIHYGRSAGLSVLSGTSFGSGIKGAEQQRLAQPGVDPRIKRRVYFYLPMEGGIPQAEIGLGANVYTANLSNLYDPSINPMAGLPSTPNEMESAILDAGYRGYINREQGTAVVLNSDVPVKAIGRAETQTILKRKPQVIAPKITTQESGNDLVRKPTSQEMMDIIKVRPKLNTAAPSFKLEFGSARVAKTEADAANAVFEKAGSTFMFSKRAAQTETPEFKRWFGDSKVVDAQGKPMVMYHGTDKEISSFTPKNGMIFLTPKADFASNYTTGSLETLDKNGGQPNIMPVYVKAENAFDFENPSHIKSLEAYEKANRYTDRSISYLLGDMKRGWWEAMEDRKAQAAIKALGHDGFHLVENGVKNLAVFDPSQIKSATGNIGTFDETNPDIRRSNRSIGQALQERINANPEQVIGEYESLKGTDGGRILDTDMVRELSPEYRADRSRAAEVHEASSFLTQAMFDSRIANNKSGIVAFMAGGGGAGKSTADDLVAEKLSKSHTILDGTLSSYDKAKRNIETAINAGNKALVVYVYREPVEALRNGVLTRAERMGRTVTIDALVKGHAGSSTVVRKLQEEFGDNPMFELVVIDNSRGQGNAKIANLSDITPVIQSGLKERLQNATESEFQKGRIGETVYRATTASYPDARGGDQAGLGSEGSDRRTQGGVQGRAGSEQLQLSLTKLFTDLRGARGLKLARVQEQVENNPLSAEIKNVEENFYDIVGQLEEDGLIKINCK